MAWELSKKNATTSVSLRIRMWNPRKKELIDSYWIGGFQGFSRPVKPPASLWPSQPRVEKRRVHCDELGLQLPECISPLPSQTFNPGDFRKNRFSGLVVPQCGSAACRRSLLIGAQVTAPFPSAYIGVPRTRGACPRPSRDLGRRRAHAPGARWAGRGGAGESGGEGGGS